MAWARALTAGAISVLLLLPVALSGAAEARDPATGDFFEYKFHRRVGDGGGAYDGYSEDLYSTGRYEVRGVAGAEVQMQTRYDWSYSTSDGVRDRGTEERQISFSLADRRYTSLRTDNDELDAYPASRYTVWFWIAQDVFVGKIVRVYEADYTVTSLDATVWAGGLPRKAVELKATGANSRDDTYGVFNYHWEDRYYFDRATGWFVAEHYVEWDTGSWQGDAATFTLWEDIEYAGGSFAPPVDGVALAGFFAKIAFVLLLLAGLALAIHRRPRVLYSVGPFFHVKIRHIRSLDKIPALAPLPGAYSSSAALSAADADNGVTREFTAFVHDFANKSLLAGDKVAAATTSQGLVGLALYNRDAHIGSVMARETGLAEALRKLVGAKDFFSEWRHQVPLQAQADAREVGVTIPAGDAYNLFDTYFVLKLERFPGTEYDTQLVSRMQTADLDEVTAMAKSVYKVDSVRWVRAQFDSGDVGFVARIDGKIVGFAFATFANGAGRVHSLTVAQGFRNRGIGRELMRARLHALEALGARYVIAEIAQWNLPSLELAYSHGFAKSGELFVETARTARIKKDIVRR